MPGLFTDPRTALRLFKAAGVQEFSVRLGGWHPRLAKEFGAKRPDVTSSLTEAHQLKRENGLDKKRAGS